MGKVLFKFDIQSYSDVITNSSSELFVFNDKGDNKQVEELLDDVYPNWRSEYCEPVRIADADRSDLEWFIGYYVKDTWNFTDGFNTRTQVEEIKNSVEKYTQETFGVEAKKIYKNIDTWVPDYRWWQDEKYKGKDFQDLTSDEIDDLFSKENLDIDYDFVVDYMRKNMGDTVLLFSSCENPNWVYQEVLEGFAERYHLG